MSRRSRRERFKGANGTGTVYERPNGKHQGQVALGRKADGTLRRLSKTFATKNEATAWVRRTLVGWEEGTLREPSQLTVAQFAEQWVASNPAWSEATQEATRTVLNHVLPVIGGIKVQQLNPSQVQHLLNELRKKPAEWPKRAEGAPANDPLSEAMVRRILERLRTMLNHAVQLELLQRNPAERVPLPRVRKARRDPWTLVHVQAVIEYCRGSDLVTRDYWVAALGTGLRIQELRGLRWKDVNLDDRFLRVRQVVVRAKGGLVVKPVPKSEAGYRLVDFDDVTAAAFARQLVTFGADSEFVFPNEQGGFLGSKKLASDMARVAVAAGVPVIQVYDTRHTHGTLLAAAGVNPKVLSVRMGHATVAMTLDNYVQPDRAAYRAAGRVMGSLLQPAATGGNSTVDAGTNGDSESALLTPVVTQSD